MRPSTTVDGMPVGTGAQPCAVVCRARFAPTAQTSPGPAAQPPWRLAMVREPAGTQPMVLQSAIRAVHSSEQRRKPASKPRSKQLTVGGEPSQASGPLIMPSPQRPLQVDASKRQNGVQVGAPSL